MKKALKLLLTFLMFLVIGIILGTVFYSFYLSSLKLVVGRTADIFSKTDLVNAFFLSGEVLSFMLGIFLISYRIRHSGGGLQLIAYILTQAICWGILFPSVLYLEARYNTKHFEEIEEEIEQNHLSKGFFRVYDKDVYYFLDDLKTEYEEDEEGIVAVKIDSSETGIVDIVEITNPEKIDVVTQAEPYKDIIIKKEFAASRKSFLSFVYGIVELARTAFAKGWTFWLGFISLGFAVGCVYAISELSSWRMINFTVTTITAVGILYWNYIFTTPVLENFRNLKLVNIQLGSLNNYLDNIFLIFTNLLVGIVLIIIGTITYFVNKKRQTS